MDTQKDLSSFCFDLNIDNEIVIFDNFLNYDKLDRFEKIFIGKNFNFKWKNIFRYSTLFEYLKM